MRDHEDYEAEFDDHPNDADIQVYVQGQPLAKEIGDLIEDMAAHTPHSDAGYLRQRSGVGKNAYKNRKKKINYLELSKNYDTRSEENAS